MHAVATGQQYVWEPPAPGNGKPSPRENPPKYVERDGQLVCNQKLANGSVCGGVGKMRTGRYGPFFSCPRYRQHAK